MPNNADVVLQNNELVLSGNLDFTNVMRVFEKGLAQFNTAPNLVFNFAGLKTSNSAGVALMIEWVRCAKQRNKAIKFQSVSPELLSIAKAAGLDKLLS